MQRAQQLGGEAGLAVASARRVRVAQAGRRVQPSLDAGSAGELDGDDGQQQGIARAELRRERQQQRVELRASARPASSHEAPAHHDTQQPARVRVDALQLPDSEPRRIGDGPLAPSEIAIDPSSELVCSATKRPGPSRLVGIDVEGVFLRWR
jgi:hypothetical protein